MIDIKTSFFDAVSFAFIKTGETIGLSISVLAQAFIGKMSIDNLIGPLQVATLAESSLNTGYTNFFK